jgi:hypothetical protein
MAIEIVMTGAPKMAKPCQAGRPSAPGAEFGSPCPGERDAGEADQGHRPPDPARLAKGQQPRGQRVADPPIADRHPGCLGPEGEGRPIASNSAVRFADEPSREIQPGGKRSGETPGAI